MITTLDILDKTIDIMREKCMISRPTFVTTCGCFDLFHLGHLILLQEASELGTHLIVGVNSDKCVRRLKGPGRPIIPEQQRLEIVSRQAGVWAAFLFNESTPIPFLKKLEPEKHVKGSDYTNLIEQDVVEGYGGEIVKIPIVTGISTTNIITRIRQSKSLEI